MQKKKPATFDAKRHLDEGPSTKTHEYRNEFQRDRDRVLYSSAFRRLAGVTQVAAVREHALLHNRLTHSIKVAQVGRGMADYLTYEGLGASDLDKDSFSHLSFIVETAGLAHDLGHPPFGHIAEEILAEKMKDHGGFEGNAQSFRIVTKLAVGTTDRLGLNLTRASLNAILKYPRFLEDESVPLDGWWDRSRGLKWGAYRSEQEQFQYARELSPAPDGQVRSVAAIIMDWADDVSFATHDIEDYCRAGLIPLPLPELRANDDPFVEFVYRCNGQRIEKSAIVEAYNSDLIQEFLPKTKFEDTRQDRIELNKFTSKFIDELFGAVHVITPSASPFIEVDKNLQAVVQVLKGLTWYHVITKPSLRVAQEGQKRIIGHLFGALSDLLTDSADEVVASRRVSLPVLLQEIYRGIVKAGYVGTEIQVARAVCDYICLLTEDQALDLYERITGQAVARGSIFGAWFH